MIQLFSIHGSIPCLHYKIQLRPTPTITVNHFFRRVLATLKPATLVGRSVRRCKLLKRLLHYCSCPNAWVGPYPAHPYATSVAVYPALFNMKAPYTMHNAMLRVEGKRGFQEETRSVLWSYQLQLAFPEPQCNERDLDSKCKAIHDQRKRKNWRELVFAHRARAYERNYPIGGVKYHP